MNDTEIRLTDVTVHRGGRNILDVPGLIVPGRAFLGVVGPNGAGKTTLLAVCSGLLRADRGEVTVLGRALGMLSSRRRTDLRRRIAWVPQRTEYNAALPLTVREVVALGRVGPRGLLRRLTDEDAARVETWLDRLGLASLAGRTFRSLSGGEQQKALIARAMTQEPRILLLDEPGAGLDMDWKERVVDLLETLHADEPITVVMVTHDTGMLPRCTSQVALLRDGRLLTTGACDEVLTPTHLARVYGCAIEVVLRRGRTWAVAAGRH